MCRASSDRQVQPLLVLAVVALWGWRVANYKTFYKKWIVFFFLSRVQNERGLSLVGSLDLSCRYNRFLSCLGCSSQPSTKYFLPHHTLFFTLLVPIAQHPGQAVSIVDPHHLITLMRIRMRFLILIFIWSAQIGSFSMYFCHLQIDADPVPDPAYHFDADPDADSDFYFLRIRILIWSGSRCGSWLPKWCGSGSGSTTPQAGVLGRLSLCL